MQNVESLQPEQEELLLTRNASYISYSTEFSSLIGFNSVLKLIEERPTSSLFAHEDGIYIPETNEVWFSTNQLPVQNTNVTSLNLVTDQLELLDIYPPINTPNGTKAIPAGIYAVNPTTRISKLVVNSWFGYRLNSPNDVTFSATILGKDFMWSTDPQIAFSQGFSDTPQFRSTAFRYDMITSELRPVINDLITPNGIAFDQNETTLYVTDTTPDMDMRVVYAYDLNVDGLPMNRRLFSVSSFGVPDGIKVDKNNRVWIAEGDGISVRDRHGTLLDVILGHDLSPTGLISNFALAQNTVIILAQDSL